MSNTRQTAREALGALLVTALEGTGKLAQKVYDYWTGNIEGQSPVVVVSSSGVERPRMTAKGHRVVVYLQVDVYSVYAMADGTWTEADAEDNLDAIEAEVAAVMSANQVTAAWDALDYAERTRRQIVAVGGTSYAWEAIFLRAEVHR
jgi:hypothetical protein